MELFGSAATGAFDPERSDVDFLVAFSDTRSPGYADRYRDFAEALEAVLGRPVDLVTERSVRNSVFRRELEATRLPLYKRRNPQAAA